MHIVQLAESIYGFEILKIFAQRPLTKELVKNAARNFKMRDMPSIELIPASAESGKGIEDNDINPEMNIGNYGRILSSA